MTIQPSPYEIIRAIQDQQRATDRLVQILVGLLDKSAPDPIMSTALSILPVAADRPHRRAVGDAGRPPVLVELDGVEIRTTERRAKIITLLKSETLGLTDLVRRRAVPNTKAASSQLRDINLDLERSGSPFRLVSDRAHPSRRAARYRLAIPSEIAPLPSPAAVDEIQNAQKLSNRDVSTDDEPSSGAVPQDEAPLAGTGGETLAGRESEHEEHPGSMPEGACEAPQPIPVERTKGPATLAARSPIEPGDLIAVDVKFRKVQTRQGAYEVAGANLARALDRLKGGQMFGLDVVARVAGWPNAEVAKTALVFERPRLAEHGLDLYLDKINVRLRSAS
ncbi:hypothetical protein AB4Z40_08675 [Bosea sp. 2YAB26]|uniref:hypothetical protein n=1 Tax=Bosea sp. 2YAB26 TaxID=3237478 RepID=UPI003F934D84